ncbi:N-acetylmuramoyl-L-alanine amidase [Deinococcus sonorensis]|uniref:N-acetylmuramoyl-L-alanine amidase n=2 Tax=Deinococcus sonorensis TaxID=309891 RepID=A0AAU7U841_9DEIO
MLRQRVFCLFLSGALWLPGALSQPLAPAVSLPGPVSTAPIFVAYPPEAYRVAFDHVIFEGSVQPGATLSVNGRPLAVGPDGLFREWLPLAPGLNTLQLSSVQDGVVTGLTRHVTRTVPPAPAAIQIGTIQPDRDLTWYGLPAAQDRAITVSFRGTPGGRAMFWLGTRGPYTMSAEGDRYSGSATLRADDTFQNAAVRVRLIGAGGARSDATAPGRLTLAPGPRVAEVTAADIGRGVNPDPVSWSVAGGLGLVYPPQGVQFGVVGLRGDRYLTRLPGVAPLLDLDRRSVRLLPPGTALPPARLDQPSLADEGRHLTLALPLGSRVPFTLTQTADGLDLRLYRTAGDPAALNAVPLTDPLLAGVQWSREGEGGPLLARLRLASSQAWGYDAAYQDTTLSVRLRRPSEPAQAAGPLGGLTIVVDPGHGGSEQGGAGALRVPEKDLNLSLGLQVAAGLRALGARVVLTRQSDVTVPLYNRPLLAETMDADLLLSIHANALPDGRDPRGRRGSGVYWTRPQALPLAQRIQAALQRALPELGDDGLHLADLALTRPSSQLSLLIETAYLTDPDNLRLLMSDAGRSRIAVAVVQGVQDFYAERAGLAAR